MQTNIFIAQFYHVDTKFLSFYRGLSNKSSGSFFTQKLASLAKKQ